MAFVLDASVAASWAFDDEDHPRARAAYSRLVSQQAFTTSLMWFEVRNTLIVNERRKRLTEADTARFVRALNQFSIRVDNTPEEDRILHLSRAHKLTVHDAAYLELAEREGVALSTLDAALARAARAEGVPLL